MNFIDGELQAKEVSQLFSIKAEEQFSLVEISHTFNIPPDFCFSGLTIANSGFPSKSLSSIGI